MSRPVFEKVPLVEVNSVPRPMPNGPQKVMTEQFEQMQHTDLKLKRHIRIFRFISRILSAVLSAAMLGAMIYALQQYFTTRDQTVPGRGGHPWAPNTILWPTYMLLAISGISLVMNAITLFFYCYGVEAANRVSNSMTYLGYAVIAVHVVVWAIAMGLFKMANDGSDLWGFSCSENADAISHQVQGFLNFDNLCMVQTGTWFLTIVQTITYIVLFFTYLAIGWRIMHKRKLQRMEERIISSQVY
ncbi:hypothetical protein MMC30_000793 [Trapelia coarctata]|nr:hypothetical protein [Trapelia coarctata]